jgi:hypothetical protein
MWRETRREKAIKSTSRSDIFKTLEFWLLYLGILAHLGMLNQELQLLVLEDFLSCNALDSWFVGP